MLAPAGEVQMKAPSTPSASRMASVVVSSCACHVSFRIKVPRLSQGRTSRPASGMRCSASDIILAQWRVMASAGRLHIASDLLVGVAVGVVAMPTPRTPAGDGFHLRVRRVGKGTPAWSLLRMPTMRSISSSAPRGGETHRSAQHGADTSGWSLRKSPE